MAAKVEPFWQRKSLAELSSEEWEQLCDGCGLCCLHKLEDDEDGGVYYTRVACQLLDLDTCACGDYDNRQQWVPDCVQLTVKDAARFTWLPSTCAYRLLAEGRSLPSWHPLVCGDSEAVHVQRISLAGRMLSECSVAEEDWEKHLVFRVD